MNRFRITRESRLARLRDASPEMWLDSIPWLPLLLVALLLLSTPLISSENSLETNLTTPGYIELHNSPNASFHEGLAAIRVGDLWGYVDGEGNVIIQPRFQHALAFSEGLARIKLNGLYGYINRSGKITITPRFQKAHSFREGLARVCSPPPPNRSTFLFRLFRTLGWDDREAYLCGYIDQTGKLVIDYQYVPAHGFKGGYARIRLNGKDGYIDHSGKFSLTRDP